MSKKIGKMPEFTSEDTPPEVTAEATTESVVEQTEEVEEKETPTVPPAVKEPDDKEVEKVEKVEPEVVVDSNIKLEVGELKREIEGLSVARKELIADLKDLRGLKRDLQQEKIDKLENQIKDKEDTLNDINPNDVDVIDRVLKAKGYVPRQEINKMFYEERKNEEIAKFLSEFPEYSEKNDPDNKMFGPLLQEVGLYKEPTDPALWGTILRRAHRVLSSNKNVGGSVEVKKQLIKTASVGAKGASKPTSAKPMDDRRRRLLEDAGFSEEEIRGME